MTDRLRGPSPGQRVVLKENPAPDLASDARRTVEAAHRAAERGDIEAEASFARASVFLFFAALEGFINFVYAWSEVRDISYAAWSTERKWRRAAEQCLPYLGTVEGPNGEILHIPGQPIEPVDGDAELLAQLIEWRDSRNAMMHAQAVFTSMPARQMDEHLAQNEYHPKTGLPKKLTHFRAEHGETVAALFAAMVDRLDLCLKGQIRWLIDAPVVYEYTVRDDRDE